MGAEVKGCINLWLKRWLVDEYNKNDTAFVVMNFCLYLKSETETSHYCCMIT